MAYKAVVASDISGEPGAATVSFGLGDTWFEVDLLEEEKEALEQALARYVEVARMAGKRGAKKYAPETTAKERERIRAWGREQGYEVSDRGQIPNDIYLAYHEAMSKSGAKAAPETTAKQRERIRAWGREQGYRVGEKGRIPNEVIAGYLAAHEAD